MIDIHTHIIPGFDDGSRSLEESLDIARFESEGGTEIMFATPHVQTEKDVLNAARIGELVQELNGEFEKNSIQLRVVPGAELYPSMSVIHGLDQNLPISLGGTGKYVLLDLPHSLLPMDFDTILFEIQSRGVTPILAHPERCPAFQPEPENVLSYVERGITFQLNMGSFVGRHGPQAQACAHTLFDMRIAHFLASDAHRLKSFNLGKIAKSLDAKSAAYVKLLTQESGEAVLKGVPLPTLPEPVATPKKKSSWLSRLISR